MKKSRVVKIFFLVAIFGLIAAIVFNFIKSPKTPGQPPRLPSLPSSTATLEIVANIPQVKIALDSPEDFPDINQLKELPQTIANITPGRHLIFAYKEGYQEYIKEFEVLPNRKTRLEIIMYPKIQLIFEYFRTGPIVKSFSWLDDKTILYQKENSLAEASSDTERDLVRIPEGSIISWSNKGGIGVINHDSGLFLYKYPNRLERIGERNSLVSLSPAGTKIARLSENYLKVVAVQDPEKEETVTPFPLLETPTEIIWSPDERHVLLVTRAGKETSGQLIDTENKLVKPLPAETTENIPRISFSSSGAKIAYAKERSVVITNLEGQIVKEIGLEVATASASIAWLNEDELLLIEKEEELPFLDRLFLINLNSPEEKRFLVTSATIIGRLDLGFKPIVSPTRDKILLLENNGPLLGAVIERAAP